MALWTASTNAALSANTAVNWFLVPKPDQGTTVDYPNDQGSLVGATSNVTSATYRSPADPLQSTRLPEPTSSDPGAFLNGKVYSLAVRGEQSSSVKNFVTITLRNREVPPRWIREHVGPPPGVQESVTENVGQFTIAGAGDQIWWDRDDFRFMYTHVTGNQEIVARLVSMTRVVNPNRGGVTTTKAGIMLRAGLERAAPTVFVALHASGDNPANPQPRALMQIRANLGGLYADPPAWSPLAGDAPKWLKLKRTKQGSAYQITGFVADGSSAAEPTTWTQIGQYTMSMAEDVQAGLAVSSEFAGEAATAVFEKVVVRDAAGAWVMPLSDTQSLRMTGTPQDVQFNATVVGTTDPRVTWSVTGGAGSVDSTGKYTSPAAVAAPAEVQIVAASVDVPGKSGSATLTLNPAAAPIAVTILPTSASLYPGQSHSFSANVPVTWSFAGTADGTLSASGVYTAPASSLVAGARTVTIRATSTEDAARSSTAAIALRPLAVTVSPAPAAVRPGDPPVTFTAAVEGSSQGVTWQWTAGPGTFQANGYALTYTPPASASTTSTMTITARSVQDPNRLGWAGLTVSRDLAATVVVTPVNGQGYGPVPFQVATTYAAQVTDVHQILNTSLWDPNFVSYEFNCWIWYSRTANLLFLWNGQLGNWVNPAGDAPGTAVSRSNPYCTLNVAAATRQDGGTSFTVTLPVTFANRAPGDVGTRRLWTTAALPMGLWTYQGYWNLY